MKTNITEKSSLLFTNLYLYVIKFPTRLFRVFDHLLHPFRDNQNCFQKNEAWTGSVKLIDWLLSFILLMLELLGVADLLEVISDWIKFKTRRLSLEEIELVQSVFGNQLPLHAVRLDETANYTTNKGKYAYVSFNTINSAGKLSKSILIHEMIHIWQYQQKGILYIPRALKAQRAKEGYNYGGSILLLENSQQGLAAFNYEQQGDIVSDYFRLREGFRPKWIKNDPQNLAAFLPYIEELKGEKNQPIIS